MDLHAYRAEVVRVIDGNTLVLNVDLGFHLHHRITLCLLDVVVPDKKKMGNAAGQFLSGVLPVGRKVIVETTKHDVPEGGFGRWLGDVFLDEHGALYPVSQLMRQQGYARQ